MKSKILFAFIILFMGVLTSFTLNTTFDENSYCHHGQCSKIKDDGYRCKNCSQEGSRYCWSHNN